MKRTRSSKISPLDLLVVALILCGCAFIAYRLFYSLEYKWNWSIIPGYLFRFDETSGTYKASVLIQGLLTTIKLSVWATLLAAILGFIFGIIRTSPRLFFKLLSTSYVELIRNLPPLVLIFIFYFFISDQFLPIFGIEDFFRSRSENEARILSIFFAEPTLITPFISGVITIGLFQGAYITEIVRAGIQSITRGQWEAASALGLSKWQRMRLVIFPQAFKIMLPPLANEFINTIKYSSIISVISIQELTFQGLQVMASTQVTIEVWLTITLMYLILCMVLSLLVNWMEKRLV